MHSLTRNGAGYRTHLMTSAQCAGFERCLHKHGHFHRIERQVYTDPADPRRCYYLTYLPKDPARLEAFVKNEMLKSRERAEAEGSGYIWVADLDSGTPREWEVLTLTGSVYRVREDLTSCTCPHFVNRCAPAMILCKHILAFALNLGTFYTSEDRPLYQHTTTHAPALAGT